MDKEIVISIKTVLFTFALALALYVVYRLGNIIGLFAIAILIVFAIEPLIKKLMHGTVMNRKVPRSMAVIISYAMLILVFIVVFTIWLPPLVVESQKLVRNFPKILSSIQVTESFGINLADLVPQASKVSGSLLTVTLSIFSNLAALFSIFIMSLYVSLDWPHIKSRFASLFPSKAEDLVLDIIDEVELSLGHWLKGESILMLVVGTASFVGLFLLNVDYPLAIGLIAGFLEAVPMIGPLITAVLAVIIALADSPVKALGVVVLCIIIQQLENNLLVPKVMQKVSGFSPLIILFSLLVGGEFFGLVGAVIAIPSAMTISIIIRRVVKFMR